MAKTDKTFRIEKPFFFFKIKNKHVDLLLENIYCIWLYD